MTMGRVRMFLLLLVVATVGHCYKENGLKDGTVRKSPTCADLQKAIKAKGLIGAYIPQCDENGNFRPKQCHASTGFCWCVNADGKKISNTGTEPGKDLDCSSEKGNHEECTSDPDTGPCKAYFERWYFDHEDKKCKTFVYGGCKGNDNNFQTEEECKIHCKSG